MLTPEILRAKRAILIGYIANGIALGSFIARIPDYKRTRSSKNLQGNFGKKQHPSIFVNFPISQEKF